LDFLKPLYASFKYIKISKKNVNKGSYLVVGGFRINTFLVVGLGIIGAVLLVLGIVFSIYGFIEGIELAIFGLIILIVVVIVFVLGTDGIEYTRLNNVYGPI
jgi:hypothetical protein